MNELAAPAVATRLSARQTNGSITEEESAGAVVLIEGRCLLVRRHSTRQWILPKGHLDPGEDPRQTAVHEVLEETGLRVALIAHLGRTRYSFGRHRENRKRVDWYLAQRVGGELELERGFDEWALLGRPGALTTLTHAAEWEVVRRAFALDRAASPHVGGPDRRGQSEVAREP